jgi:hypothetical protein
MLRKELESYRDDMEQEFDMIYKLMRIYPEVFNLEIVNYEMYKKCSAFIVTRVFGWGLPTMMMVPLGDALNHSSRS